MQRAQQRNAAVINQFHFRKNIFPLDRVHSRYDLNSRPVSPGRKGVTTPPDGQNGSYPNLPRNNHHQSTAASSSSSVPPSPSHYRESTSSTRCPTPDSDTAADPDATVEMSLNSIINGDEETGFPGLMGVVNAYLNSLNVDVCTKCEIRRYLDLIKYRARGDLVTPAAWIRNFITTHKAYKGDSVVSDEINYDLVKIIDEMWVNSSLLI